MTKPLIDYRLDSKNHYENLCKHIDTDKPVHVYKNLHTGTWSIRQNGIVKIHTNYICLKDVKYRVGKKGRERVIREGKKNVHAYVCGYICSTEEINQTNKRANPVNYDPYTNETFVISFQYTIPEISEPIHTSEYVDMYTGELDPVLAF